MEKNVTLTTDEISTIILALHDKVMNIEASFKANGIPMSEQTKRRLEAIELLKKKMFCV